MSMHATFCFITARRYAVVVCPSVSLSVVPPQAGTVPNGRTLESCKRRLR